jgi:hypothetical protein
VKRAALLAAASLALGSAGCCRIIAALEEGAPERAPSATGPATELGTAAYPAGTPSTRAVNHTWLARRLQPDTYRLYYALSPGEADAVDADLQRFARKVGYEPVGKDRFKWRPPEGCAEGIACVYQSIAARSASDVAPIAARFRARSREARMSSFDLAQLVVTFVQAIPYEIPESEPFGVLPPALVASRRKGDCDSKALLAHMVLHELGIDTMMIGSSAHHHEMLGIALPVQGKSFSYGGRKYAFTEMTAKGSPIGHINPQLLSPDDWKPMPFSYPRGAAAASEPNVPATPGVPATPKTPRKPAPRRR